MYVDATVINITQIYWSKLQWRKIRSNLHVAIKNWLKHNFITFLIWNTSYLLLNKASLYGKMSTIDCYVEEYASEQNV